MDEIGNSVSQMLGAGWSVC